MPQQTSENNIPVNDSCSNMSIPNQPLSTHWPNHPFSTQQHLESTKKLQQQHQVPLTQSATKLTKMQNLLHSELIECGWRDAMKDQCKELIRQKGLEAITSDELVRELIPVGRAAVPEGVRRRVLESVKGMLREERERELIMERGARGYFNYLGEEGRR
mmetsp:Transcript_17482/g.36684  ORF Transcript_17482/g.36684 Transcript_17482/m.36684 type:complete len:159 (+) Transcript_17482:263-739(+)